MTTFFRSFTNFNLFKRCYDALMYVYNNIAHRSSLTPSSSKDFDKWQHTCTAGCGLAGCSYGEKHQTPSYKEAKRLFCVNTSQPQQRQSFSYVYCQEGSYVRRCV